MPSRIVALHRKPAGIPNLRHSFINGLLLAGLLLAVQLARPLSVNDAVLPPAQNLHHPAARITARAALKPAKPSWPKPSSQAALRSRVPSTTAAILSPRQRAALRKSDPIHSNLWLHGIGSQLYTASNKPITLKAINWYGFEYPPFVPGGLGRAPLDSILSKLTNLGFNTLRITFADQTVESNPVVTSGLDANPQFRGLHALDVMQRILERAHRFGLRVILCNSRSEAGRGPEMKSGLWYTSDYPASAWESDWLSLARRFRNESALIGADLRNEPHIVGNSFDVNAYFQKGPLWGAFQGTYYHDRDWHYAAQTVGNALLKVNPSLLVVVEGVQMYLDPDRNQLFGGLWGSNLMGVQYDQVVLSRPSQLVYSVHEYGPKMYTASWFNPRTSYGSLSRRWQRHWGYLLAAPKLMKAPILVGEFGTCDDFYSCIASHKPASQGFWFSAFVRYMKQHPQVGWAYWALNPDGPFYAHEDNFYSLVTSDWRHFHPMLVKGLQPLLHEPNG